MLKLGLIGDIQMLEPFIKKAMKHPEVYIAGKSSVGTRPQPAGSRLTITEFNRVELIERADAFLINHFSLLPFQLLCEMVKKSKHFFATTYPELSADECTQLTKLAQEAQTIIQIANPFYYLPAIQWLGQNVLKPAFVEVSYFKNEPVGADTLLQLLLMLKNITGNIPKKTSAVSFDSTLADSVFSNLQLEFGDGSVVQINYGKKGTQNVFKVNTYAHNQFVEFDFLKGHYSCNNSPIDLSPFKKELETDTFLNTLAQKKLPVTTIEDYSSVLQTLHKIHLKLDRFSSM
ncbi:hypothetical protein D1164_08785 [Mariniphaga sediminis]|uniref:Gfo/Idh/MocA-like oxidoreductase N-terminal domain-containing protein n=1 Tax=Mariniphaga sediminis TaxID=1628158 RepID=A0A399D2N4_9BACT|nr:hypothetical protein [Mariniphaga sediminis]RIH65743.1 hypothetical protein D1164_08785 [Mariniphaga sediminis]